MAWFDKKINSLKEAIDKEKNTIVARSSLATCLHGDTNCVRCAAEDFQNPSTVTLWQRLDEDDIKRIVYALPEQVVELMRRHPGQVVVAGGFIRATVGGEDVNDIDVFVSDEDEAEKWLDDVKLDFDNKDTYLQVAPTIECPHEIQVVWRYPYKEPYEILEQFDYTVAKGAVWFDKGDKNNPSNFISLCHERFYRDIARKMLVYECEREVERIESIPRLLKYTSYGYSISPASLSDLMVKTCLSMDLSNGFPGMKKQLEAAYKPTGSGTPWEEMTKVYVAPKKKKRKTPTRSHDYSYGS